MKSQLARVVELVDTQVSEACAQKHGGSSPPSRTKYLRLNELKAERLLQPQTGFRMVIP